LLRSRGWTAPGVGWALGNRDEALPVSPIAGRADRAARNMLENLLLFVALVAAAELSGHADAARLALGARVFFWARVAYFALYVAGIPYVRTAAWGVGVYGLWLIAGAALHGGG